MKDILDNERESPDDFTMYQLVFSLFEIVPYDFLKLHNICPFLQQKGPSTINTSTSSSSPSSSQSPSASNHSPTFSSFDSSTSASLLSSSPLQSTPSPLMQKEMQTYIDLRVMIQQHCFTEGRKLIKSPIAPESCTAPSTKTTEEAVNPPLPSSSSSSSTTTTTPVSVAALAINRQTKSRLSKLWRTSMMQQKRRVKVFIVIEDVVVSYQDPRFPAGALFPGVEKLLEALSQHDGVRSQQQTHSSKLI